MKNLLIIILFLPLISIGQSLVVKGKVSSVELNENLPGATVQVKGTQRGVITDINGYFEIEASIGETLIFSFVGMKTAEIKVEGAQMNVVMEEEFGELDEVIVVSQGYFDVTKEDLTGSIAQISQENLEKVRSNSIESILQGQVAGVVVSESSEPGGGVGIAIRGTNSMLGGTQPLYVVDGIPINPSIDAQGNSGGGQSQSALSFLNPNDIEKIEVLKDAAATAIYGARGANGVVIITTKSANKSEGTHNFNVVYDQTITQVRNPMDLLTGSEFEGYMNQRVLNNLYVTLTNPNREGIVFDGTQSLTADNFPELATFELPYPQTTGVNTDWQDLTYRTALSKSLNLQYRGGSKGNNISISLGALNNEGVIINSDFNRVTLNMNAKWDAGSRVQIYSKTNLSRSWGNAASTGNGEIFDQRGVVSQALVFQPIYKPLEEGQDDVEYADLNDGNEVSNPYTLASSLTDNKQATNLLQSFSVIYKISKNLSGTVKTAFNYQRSTRDMYYPSYTTRGRRNNGEATQSYFDRTKGYLEGNMRYQRTFHRDHGLDAILIGTYEQTNDRRLFNKAFGFGNDATSYYTFASATDILVPEAVFSEFSLLSGVGRVAYNFKRKYFIDGNIRMDASSKFAANYRTAIFPAVSLSWIATKEQFLSQVTALNYMKLRASYGQTGSDPIAPYQSLALLSPIRYNFNDKLSTGYFEYNVSNPNLTWETTDQYNVGLDFNILDARFQFVIDFYYKMTHDLLQYVQLPPSNGYGTIVDNFGEVENKGFDFSMATDIIRKEQFSWTTSVNFSLNRNKLVALNKNTEFQLGPAIGFSGSYPIMFREGMPLGIFWGAQTDGIYKDWEEALASGIEGAAPGEIKYVNNNIDFDQDGNSLPIQLINFDDFVQIGDPNPDFTYAINSILTYKRVDLSFLITGQRGGDIFWVDSWQLNGLTRGINTLESTVSSSWRAPFTYSQGETLTINYDPSLDFTSGAVNPAGTTNPGSRAIASDRQIYDGSFIRLKNINLGYTHPMKQGKSLRIYLSGMNLLTKTKYPGYDPEVTAYNKDPQRRGVDFGTYPGVRSYVCGLNLNF